MLGLDELWPATHNSFILGFAQKDVV